MGSPKGLRGCTEEEKAPCAGGGHFVTRIELRVVFPLVAIPTNGRLGEASKRRVSARPARSGPVRQDRLFCF
jgi:hypothetical protein